MINTNLYSERLNVLPTLDKEVDLSYLCYNGRFLDLEETLNTIVKYSPYSKYFNGTFKNATSITNINNLNLSSALSCDGMFNGCTNLTSLTFDRYQTNFPANLTIDLSTTAITSSSSILRLAQSLPNAYNKYRTLTIKFPSSATVSSQSLSIASGKGWTLTKVS